MRGGALAMPLGNTGGGQLTAVKLRGFSLTVFIHLAAIATVVDCNSVIAGVTAPVVCIRMFAEIVDRIDVDFVSFRSLRLRSSPVE
jgi:hypothetical protein